MNKILFTFLLALSFLSCSGNGIFLSLENEELIEDTNNLNEKTPITGVLKYSDGSGYNSYLTYGKRLWISDADISGSPWNKANMPSQYGSDSVIPSVAVFQNKVYASVIQHDGLELSGIIQSDGSLSSFRNIMTTEQFIESGQKFYYSYYLFSVSSHNGLYINRVKYQFDSNNSDSATIIGSQLYYFDAEIPNNYDFTSDPDAKIVSLAGSNEVGGKILDIASNDDGSLIYLVFNKKEVKLNETPGRLFKADSDKKSFSLIAEQDFKYNRLSYVKTNDGTSDVNYFLASTLYLGSQHYIQYLKDGNSEWKALSNSISDIKFSTFVSLKGYNDDTKSTVLVGTQGFKKTSHTSTADGHGYYELHFTTSGISITDNTFSSNDNYTSSDLSTNSVNTFLYDDTNKKIYSGTASAGLWLNKNKEWTVE